MLLIFTLLYVIFIAKFKLDLQYNIIHSKISTKSIYLLDPIIFKC